MATWEDGPEYAPLERPAEFADPGVAPLSVAEVRPDRSAGLPLDQPRFELPPVPVPPLESLTPADSGEHRNPQTPYDVASVTMTPEPSVPVGLPGRTPIGSGGPAASGGAWGAAHWSGPPANTGWPAPQGQPGAPSLPPGSQPVPSSFPAPGTEQWFGPGPGNPAQPIALVDAQAVVRAMTTGLLITLGIGLIWVLAPFTFVIGFVLTARMTAAKRLVRRIYGGALAFLGLIGLIEALQNAVYGSFTTWWEPVSRWAGFLSVAMIVVIIVLVRRDLQRRQPPPYQPQPYGNGPYDQPPGPGQQPPWQ